MILFAESVIITFLTLPLCFFNFLETQRSTISYFVLKFWKYGNTTILVAKKLMYRIYLNILSARMYTFAIKNRF